ncbi:WD domain-containing protein [Histoplasma capsulatum]|uniref:WD domain-containing protein n=1 Tax=Ajellomyces capsulatus TaxID=5037 RepID=A0A8A1M0Y7_AJECA|nr:WD domain-containing protein [Histoplasma capsulatum]
MRALLPGRPPAKLQALSIALWSNIRIVSYITGHALVILSGPHKLLQTIYLDDAEPSDSVLIDEASGRIAVAGGPDISVFKPCCVGDNTWKVRAFSSLLFFILDNWSLCHKLRAPNDDERINVLSWGAGDELLAGGSRLVLWLLTDDPQIIWTKSVANPVKFAQFSHDASLIASTGQYDRLVKLWRRLTFSTEEVRFEVSYLPHPDVVTSMHWRQPHHPEQTMDNIFYTICADNKIRVWAPMDRTCSKSALQLWAEIDMNDAIQPRQPHNSELAKRRYGFIIDARDFSAATERAVQLRAAMDQDNRALEHLVEVATKSPEVCIIMDDRGHMSAWGLENVGCKARSPTSVFNITHVEGLHLSFASGIPPSDDYARFYGFAGGLSEGSFTILVHYFDGRIEWLDSKVEVLFDPSPRKQRLTSRAVWSGHTGSIKKIVRNASGKILVSRTDDNKAMIWRQKASSSGPVLVRQSSLYSDLHIHRTCLIGEGKFLINLHHHSISLWDTRSFYAERIATCDFGLTSKPLCVLLIPTIETNASTVYVAAIAADMTGVAWEIDFPQEHAVVNGANGFHRPHMRQFCKFSLGVDEDIAYILPIDPAGSSMMISGFLDLFATDIALTYTYGGRVRTWTAKVDKQNEKIDWLLTSTVETGICNPSLASGASMRKAAIVDQDRTRLTIWDTYGAQLEFEEKFPQHDIIKDLDWTSTPHTQSILSVGFPHKVVLMSQLRYDYLDAGPSWTQIREISIRDLTPHPIGDSCWLGNGNLVVGSGNQLFVYDKHIELSNRLVANLRLPARQIYVDLFGVVSRLNGTLPVFHPQFLSQCILSGKSNLVHLILTSLYRKLIFYTEGDELDGFLNIPLEDIYQNEDAMKTVHWKEMPSSYGDFTTDCESSVVDETLGTALNENLMRVALPQLTSTEQFRLVNIIECVATVDKHRRSMDDNAARYLLFFRQHVLRRSQGLPEQPTVSWREIVWALHSDSHEILVDLVSRQYQGKMLWEHAKESGIFMWITDLNCLRAQLEVVARNEYTKSDEKNPIDCSLYYLALRKKSVLQGLWRMAGWNREQSATQRLLSNNFNEPRWKTAALKNAYALLGKRRFPYAAAFFLLADHLRDAVYVCMNQLQDVQLAVAIARAYEGDDGPVLKEILEERVLVDAASEGNRWMATWAFWLLNRRDIAVRTLISPIETLIHSTPSSPTSPGTITLRAKSYLSHDPALVILYKQLRDKTLQTLKGASKVPARDEWEFVLRNARLYDRMGCDLLGLNLVREWEFLKPPPPLKKNQPTPLPLTLPDLRKLLKRRGSLVVADMPTSPSLQEESKHPISPHSGKREARTMFEEPDPNSLLDSFGF